MLELVWPTLDHLASYTAALNRGWSPDNSRPAAAQEELIRIVHDPDRFIREQVDREASGPPIIMPDGSTVKRLPGYVRWMWDGEFCGSIGFRWQPGTTDLPPYCLGHIGYSVVPWKQNRGYATRALEMLLHDVRQERLPFVEIVAARSNVASRRVIEKNGGILVERFRKPAVHGGDEGLRFRINFNSMVE